MKSSIVRKVDELESYSPIELRRTLTSRERCIEYADVILFLRNTNLHIFCSDAKDVVFIRARIYVLIVSKN